MQLRNSVTKEEILAAIPDSYGLVTRIAEKLKCTPDAVNCIIDQNIPEINNAIDNENARQEDLIVEGIIESAKKGEPRARELYLKTLAKKHSTNPDRVNSGNNGPLVTFHSDAPVQITQENKEGTIANWSKKAVTYHREQQKEVEKKDVSELLAVRPNAATSAKGDSK